MLQSGRIVLLATVFVSGAAQAAAGSDATDRARPVAGDAAEPIGAAARQAVFSIEAVGSTATGFLVDPSGLILTSGGGLPEAQYITVGIDATKTVAARLLSHDAYEGLAVIRVHPQAVTGIAPLRLSDSDSDPDRGDFVVPIPNPAADDRPDRKATVVKTPGNRICFDAVVGPQSSGGPLLDLAGEVIGIHTANEIVVKKRPAACALAIQAARKVLDEARSRLAEIPAPPADPVTEVSDSVYPVALARERSAEVADPEAYRMRAGEVNLEFLTPPLIHSLAGRMSSVYRPEEGLFRWRRYGGINEPVVVVQVLPDVRVAAGTGFRIAGYLVGMVAYFAVALLLALLLFPVWIEEDDPLLFFHPVSPPRAAYRFERGFTGMTLLRDGVEITPLDSAVICDPVRLEMAIRPTQKVKERKVGGCHGVYRYPPAAFEPGHDLELRIEEGGRPSKGGPVPVDPRLVDRVGADFEPYFSALQKERATQEPP
jgi:hypothetical protein